jgi:hypothetical protein
MVNPSAQPFPMELPPARRAGASVEAIGGRAAVGRPARKLARSRGNHALERALPGGKRPRSRAAGCHGFPGCGIDFIRERSHASERRPCGGGRALATRARHGPALRRPRSPIHLKAHTAVRYRSRELAR